MRFCPSCTASLHETVESHLKTETEVTSPTMIYPSRRAKSHTLPRKGLKLLQLIPKKPSTYNLNDEHYMILLRIIYQRQLIKVPQQRNRLR